jgi:hypothetical protein
MRCKLPLAITKMRNSNSRVIPLFLRISPSSQIFLSKNQRESYSQNATSQKWNDASTFRYIIYVYSVNSRSYLQLSCRSRIKCLLSWHAFSFFVRSRVLARFLEHVVSSLFIGAVNFRFSDIVTKLKSPLSLHFMNIFHLIRNFRLGNIVVLSISNLTPPLS